MEDMAQDFGWSLDDFWEEEHTPEQEAAEYRAFIKQQEQEAYAEFLDAPNCFDWFDNLAPWGDRPEPA